MKIFANTIAIVAIAFGIYIVALAIYKAHRMEVSHETSGRPEPVSAQGGHQVTCLPGMSGHA